LFQIRIGKADRHSMGDGCHRNQPLEVTTTNELHRMRRMVRNVDMQVEDQGERRHALERYTARLVGDHPSAIAEAIGDLAIRPRFGFQLLQYPFLDIGICRFTPVQVSFDR
jgi:hypothetical protein